MKSCILTRKQIDCLLSFEFPFPIPPDLSLLSKEDIIIVAKALEKDGLEFINDEPTDRCLICESILDKIQDNMFPNIYDFILQTN